MCYEQTPLHITFSHMYWWTVSNAIKRNYKLFINVVVGNILYVCVRYFMLLHELHCLSRLPNGLIFFCLLLTIAMQYKQYLTANTPFTQSLRPPCLPRATIKVTRSSLDTQRRHHGCIGRSKVVHRTFNSRHGRRGRHQVLNVFKTAAEGSPRRLVAQRSLNWGKGGAVASPWLQNGCTSVSQSSPRNICVLYQSSVPQCGRRFCLSSTSAVPPIACFEWWLWRPLCLHSAIMATLEQSCRRFCLLSASLCDLFCLHILSLNMGGLSREAQRSQGQLHRNKLIWFWATVSGHIMGCSKVARRSQPCAINPQCHIINGKYIPAWPDFRVTIKWRHFDLYAMPALIECLRWRWKMHYVGERQ